MSDIIKKLLQLFGRTEKRKIALLVFMMIIGGCMDSIGVSLIGPLVLAILDASSGWADPWYARIFCSAFHIDTYKEYIITLLLLLIAVFVVKNLYLLLEYYLQYSFVSRQRFRMQRKMMDYYVHRPYEFFLYTKTADVLRVITADVDNSFWVLQYTMTVATEGIVAAILSVTIFIVSPLLTVLVAAVLVAEILLLYFVITPTTKKLGVAQRAANVVVNTWILQAIQGIKSIRVSNAEDFFLDQFSDGAREQCECNRKANTLAMVPRLIMEAVTMACLLSGMLFMVAKDMDLRNMLPQLTALAVAAMRLLPCANRISSTLSQIPVQAVGLNNVIAAMEQMRQEDPAAREAVPTMDDVPFRQEIRLQDITYAYPHTENNIFEGACISIQSGQSVGIVGTSGAGKTTAVDILLGLLRPQKGQVLVDGVDITANLPAWRSNLAYIPQQIFLLDSSIRDNIIFGRPRPDSEEQIWHSLQEAQLDDFVRSLPQGLDTQIGERGVRLSGGQRQRIGIARALYGDPDLLVFDEATSALDNATESAVMESINSLKNKKTMIIIAHRLGTIENCDIVYRVENCQIVRER